MVRGYASEIFVSFQGEGAHVGERHLFIRMAVCNLRCRYCDTPGSLVRTPFLAVHRAGLTPTRVPNPIGTAELIRHSEAFLEEEGPIDAVALTGGEPLVQADFLATFLHKARFPVPVLLETNGMLPDRLREVLGWVNIISMDIKLPSNTGEGAFWNEHEQFLRVAEGKDVYVKVLVDRGTALSDMSRAAEIVAANGGAPIYIQPIMNDAGRPEIDSPTLHRLFAGARRAHRDVRVLPQTHKILGIQ
jgi:7-carboxy-7-deazaguanine synthase